MTFGEIPFSPEGQESHRVRRGRSPVARAQIISGVSISCWVSYVKRKGSAGKSPEVWAQTC